MPTVDLNSPDGAKKIASILERRITDLMRMATIEFYRQITISTPVDTGRARAGWFVTVNAPSEEVPPEGKYSLKPIDKLPDVTVKDRYLITNNVPYIGRLNKGYSKQAPARFVELAAARVQAAISKLWKRIK